MSRILKLKLYALFIVTFASLTAQAGTWGTMGFNSGKWGATPDVYTISLVETGYNMGELVVTFSLDGSVGAAPETDPTSFSVSCDGVTVVSTGSPVTLTGLTVGVDYFCTVVATNASGSSSASIGVIGTPEEGEYRSNILKIIMIKITKDTQTP